MQKISCHHCHHQWEYTPPLGRNDECPQCRRDAHVCHNCTHHDRNFHHECRENQSEYVQVKDRANFCDLFNPKLSTASGASGMSAEEQARKKLEALFK